MAPGVTERMYRGMEETPLAKRGPLDVLFTMHRHSVFTINPDSADHVTNIIYHQQYQQDVNDVRKLEVLQDFHVGYDPRNPERTREAPLLRRVMKEAHQKWAEILRDEDLVDVRVVVHPSEERDFEHIYPAVNLKEHPFGNQAERFAGLKKLLEEEGGAKAYCLHIRSKFQFNMGLDLVITREELERIATPRRKMVLNFEVRTNTAPAPPPESAAIVQPETSLLRRNQASTDLLNFYRKPEQKSSKLQLSIRGAPKRPWYYPYSGGARVQGQPDWSNGKGPFLRDIGDPESNNDWISKDYQTRAAQIDEWKAAKQAREISPQPQTAVPAGEFRRMEGLSQCRTYTADSNLEWYEQHLKGTGNAKTVKAFAMRAVEEAKAKYDEVAGIWRTLDAQLPQIPQKVAYYRRAMDYRMEMLQRALQLYAHVATGRPADELRQRLAAMGTDRDPVDAPISQAQPGHPPIPIVAQAVNRRGSIDAPILQAEPGHTPIPQIAQERDRRGSTGQRSRRPPPIMQALQRRSPALAAEPGHTPMPQFAKEVSRQGFTGQPSRRQPPILQAPQRRLPAFEVPKINRLPAQTAYVERAQLDDSEQLANIAYHERAAMPTREPAICEPPPEMSQTDVDKDEYRHVPESDNVVLNKVRRISFQLPGEPSPHSTRGAMSRDDASDNDEGSPSSNKENDCPLPNNTHTYAEQSTGKMSEDADLAQLRSPGMDCNNASPRVFPTVPKFVSPSVSPTTPTGFTIRSGNQDGDALRALQLAATRHDDINLGSPPGVYPALRSLVSGITRGLS